MADLQKATLLVAAFHILVNVLLIAGGFNWLYVAITGKDFILTNTSQKTAQIIEGTVGAAAIIKLGYLAIWCFKMKDLK